MKQITSFFALTALLLFFVMSSETVTAYSVADYPSFFVHDGKFGAHYVVGAEGPALDVVSATVLSTALAKYPNVTTEIGTAQVDSDIQNISSTDAIIIGSPCDNSAAAALENNPDPCYKNLGGSAAYIKLFTKNGHFQLLISGLTPEDRNVAAHFLAEQSLRGLNETAYSIPTNTHSQLPFFSQKNNMTNDTINKTIAIPTPAIEVQNQSAPTLPAPEINNTVQTPFAPKQEVVPFGAYEPIGDIPIEHPSFFARLMHWIRSFFE